MGKTSQNRSHVNSPVDEPCEARPQGEGVSPSQRLQELKHIAEGIASAIPENLPDIRRRLMDWAAAFELARNILQAPSYGSYADVRLVKSGNEVRIGWIKLSPAFSIKAQDIAVTLEAIRGEVEAAIPRMLSLFMSDLQGMARDIANILASVAEIDQLKVKIRWLEEEISDR